jgi:hypothetical protein
MWIASGRVVRRTHRLPGVPGSDATNALTLPSVCPHGQTCVTVSIVPLEIDSGNEESWRFPVGQKYPFLALPVATISPRAKQCMTRYPLLPGRCYRCPSFKVLLQKFGKGMTRWYLNLGRGGLSRTGLPPPSTTPSRPFFL